MQGLLGHHSDDLKCRLKFNDRCSSWSAPWVDYIEKARGSQGHSFKRLAVKE